MDNHIIELIPGYVLDSLDQEERLLVDRHICACDNCRADLRAYQEVLGELPYSLSFIEPPPDVKKHLMSKIRSKEQSGRDVSGPSLWQKFVDFSKNISPVWAVVSVLLVIVLGAGNIVMANRIYHLGQSQDTTNLSVINLNGTETTPDAIGLIVLSKDGEHGTLIVDRLPPLTESQQYQLWLIMDGERTSGGVFSVSKDGYGSLWVDSTEPLSNFEYFGITVEPYGGSQGPTGEKVLGSDA